MNSFKEEDLRNMSSTELRNCAKMNGVKANMKMDKIITALLKKSDEDSFVTLENKILNSSKKNKETLFDKDRESSFNISRRSTYTVEDEDSFVTLERKIMNSYKKKENLRPSNTPRRETYIVDELVDDNKITNECFVEKSASPELKKASHKSIASKRKVSFMTPLRRSTRISSATPVYNSVKDRPKTPMPNKSPDAKPMIGSSDADVPVIPLNLDASTQEMIAHAPEFKKIITPIPKRISPRFGSRAASTPKSQMPFQKKTAARFEAIAASTPIPQMKFVTKSATKTPNFNKIHQKEIDRMESIQDYQKRKQKIRQEKVKEQRKFHTPAKSNAKKFVPAKKTKIPRVFGGIPFVPVDPSTCLLQDKQQKPKLKETAKSSMNNDKNTLSKKLIVNKNTLSKKLKRAGNVKAIKNMSRENSILKQRPKFDLNASLAKKLPYKPHTGPLKPLNETNLNNTVSGTPLVSTKAVENSLIKAKRFETKELLRGVRKNRRFLLQMNNRNMNTSAL